MNSIENDEDEGETISLDDFEKLLGRDIDPITTDAQVEVVIYNPNGSSIFKVTGKAS